MLEELRIRNLGVIDEAVLPLGPGLTVVTGETGAGKTMVVTGLLMLYGGRADSARVRADAEQASVDGRLAVAVVPVAGRLDLKALARALGGSRAALAERIAAERATGYVVGGISPVGQKRPHPTVVDSSALDHPTVFVSAGRRGLDLELAPADLVRATRALTHPVRR